MANKFFSSKPFYIIVSIFFAIALFFNASATSARNEGTTQSGDVYNATLKNVPIELKYDSSQYFVSGYTSTATVQLSGYNQLSILNEESSSTRNFYLSVDLTNVKAGTVDVPIRIEQLPNGVNATIEPKTTSVTVEKKMTESFNVTPQIDETQLPDGFSIDSYDLSENTVSVTTGEGIMQKISLIEAAVPIDVVLNDNYSGNVTLHAVDSEGKILPAQISPATVHLKAYVNKPSKSVPINLKTTGTLDSSLSGMKTSLSADNVTIYGEKSALAQVNSLDASVDISGVTKEKQVTVKLSPPNGVSVSPREITVTLTPEQEPS